MISIFGAEIASSLGLDDVVATIGDGGPSGSQSPSSSSPSDGDGAVPRPRPLDTRMLSVRRREATGGDLVAYAMFWTLETGVARGGGGGGGGAVVENGPTLAMP
jgi:hypothetical protein